MKIEDLKPAKYNPRSITPEALEGLCSSIGEFGDISGLVLNKKTGNLVAGHQRLRVIKEAAVEGPEIRRGKVWAKIKVKRGKKTMIEEISVPVRVVDWPLEKEKAANLTANNPHLTGEFTPGAIELIGELEVDASQLTVDLMLDRLKVDIEEAVDPGGRHVEFDASAGNEVKKARCPECGHEFPV